MQTASASGLQTLYPTTIRRLVAPWVPCSSRLLRCQAHMASSSAGTEDEVQYSIRQGVATVVLNRPKALNSLNTFMVERLSQLLADWTKPTEASSLQPAVACVIIKGAGDKAFCAGGDVKWATQEAAAGRTHGPMHFFETEYRLNRQIGRFPLPYIALMDGTVMGGGAGVSVHGHFRVVTERTVFAMPECGIGLFPDIGSSCFLNRLSGRLGMWLGLTGTRLKGVDVRASGLATHYIPSHLLPEVEARVQQLGAAHAARLGPHSAGLDLSAVNEVLTQLETEAGPLPADTLSQQIPWINRHFAASSVAGIVESLKQRQQQLQQQQQQGNVAEGAWLEETLQALSRGSPLSQCITFKLLQRARHMTLEECLELDLRLVRRFVDGQGDFVEGVKATLIERGRAPVWKYATIQQVPQDVVLSFFEGEVQTQGSRGPVPKL